MVFIYVLELENNKYYVGKTTNPDFRLEQHFTSSGSQWTKKYKPIKILELKPNCDVYDEDKYATRINCTEVLSPNNAPNKKSGIQVEVYFSEYKKDIK